MFTIPLTFVAQCTPPIEAMALIGKLLVRVAWETSTTVNKFGMDNLLRGLKTNC